LKKAVYTGACHFFEAKLDKLHSNFIEEAKIRVLFSRPSFRYWGLDVVLLESNFFPFTCDYVFRGELGYFLLGCPFIQSGMQAFMCNFEFAFGLVFNIQ